MAAEAADAAEVADVDEVAVAVEDELAVFHVSQLAALVRSGLEQPFFQLWPGSEDQQDQSLHIWKMRSK